MSDDVNPFGDFHVHGAGGEILSNREMVALMRQAAGGNTDPSMVTTGGNKLIIPDGMSPLQAVAAIFASVLNQEQPTDFPKTFTYRPHDGANAAYAVLQRRFGSIDGQGAMSMAGYQPPQMISVRTGPKDTVQVPWGKLSVAELDNATVTFSETRDGEYGHVFHMTVRAKRKYADMIETLFVEIEAYLREHSIYRGQAIRLGDGTEPMFVDLSKVDATKVVYSADVMRRLRASVWSSMRYGTTLQLAGVPLKQTIVVHGQYGTGKTLAGYITGQVAIANKWTAIFAGPDDDLDELLELARIYGPTFVFFEDIDRVASAGSERITELQDAFDGVAAKGHDVVLMLTTNHLDRLDASMLRPGRIDVMVEIGDLDEPATEQLIRVMVPAGQLDQELDFAAICSAMTGFAPAYMAQVVQRAVRYAVTTADGSPNYRLGSVDFVDAAGELRPQLELMLKAARAENARPGVEAELRQLVHGVVAEVIDKTRISYGDVDHRLVHDPELESANAED